MKQRPDHRNSARARWLLPFLEFELPTATTAVKRAQNHKGEQLISSCFVLLQSDQHPQLAEQPGLDHHGLRLIGPLVR